MGYFTSYELRVSDNAPIDVIEQFRKFSDDADYAIDDDGDTFDATKWYSWQDDLQKFSFLFPDVVFTMTGRGEETTDYWRAFARNGQVVKQKASFTFPPPPHWTGVVDEG